MKTNPKRIKTEQSPLKINKYKGVRMRSWGSWVSEIRAPNQKTRIWLGSYSNPEAAARAYDAALFCLKGRSASNSNFPINNYEIPDDSVMSPKSIQRVAASAAANDITQCDSLSSSPYSSVSDQLDDYGSMSDMGDSWFSFDSPKFVDQMLNSEESFDSRIDDYCEADFELWSFAD